jgi:hypothetical protein
MNNLGPEALDKLSAQFRPVREQLLRIRETRIQKAVGGKDSRSILNASLWDILSTA